MKTAKRNVAVSFEKGLQAFCQSCREEAVREFAEAVDRSEVVWIELSMLEWQCLRACARDVQAYVKGAAITMAESDIDVIGHEIR